MLKNKGGFTLIELVMIIIILGILVAVAIPKYQDLTKEAKQAVVDASAGSLRSAAIITFAKNKGAKVSSASIMANLEYDSTKVTITNTNCATNTVQPNPADAAVTTRTVNLSEYCSP